METHEEFIFYFPLLSGVVEGQNQIALFRIILNYILPVVFFSKGNAKNEDYYKFVASYI